MSALAGRHDLAYEVWLVSTIQEENGLIGAQSVVDEIDLDLCINLDVGLTGDIPGVDARDFPSNSAQDRSWFIRMAAPHYSRKLSDRLVELRGQHGIPVQRAIFQQYGSDAAALLKPRRRRIAFGVSDAVYALADRNRRRARHRTLRRPDRCVRHDTALTDPRYTLSQRTCRNDRGEGQMSEMSGVALQPALAVPAAGRAGQSCRPSACC